MPTCPHEDNCWLGNEWRLILKMSRQLPIKMWLKCYVYMQWRACTWWWLCWIFNVMSWEVIVQYLIWSTLHIICTKEWVTIASNNDVYYLNGSKRFSSLIIVVARLEYPIKFVTPSFRMKNRLIILWIVWRYLASIIWWSNCMTLTHTTIIRMQWSIEIN